MICRECEDMDRKLLFISSRFDSEYFSEFSNKEKYKEKIPSENCLLRDHRYIIILHEITHAKNEEK